MARAPEPPTLGGGGRIVSISTVLFDGYPLERAIDEIARSGATHVEPAFIRGYVDFDESDFATAPARRLRQLVDAAGLGLLALSAHMALSEDDAVAMLARRIGFAAELGAGVLITNAGRAAARERIVAVLRTALPQLRDWGGMLALENPGHGAGDLVGTAAEGRLLLDAIGSPHIRLNHDAGNIHTYSRSTQQPADDYRRGADVIGHVHLKDVRATQDGWSFCAIGDGEVDLAAYLAALPASLPLSLELPLRLSRPGRGDPVRLADPMPIEELRAALRRSLDFFAHPSAT